MRGDSLRDLYAKTLALVGLGVLAGTGALVDYWPLGVHAPVAASALRLPLLARALPVPTFGISIPTSSRSASRYRPVSSRDVVTTPQMSSLPVDVSSDASVGQTVELMEPVAQVAMAESPSLAVENESAFAALDFSAPTDDRLDETMMSAPVAMTSDDSDGFLTGAFKKTGTSIVRSGVRTGAAIVDAMRVAGEAVRRALPN